jgi:hypothetical protein
MATADLDVTPGQTLGVNVGGPGAAAAKGGAAGGFNGGGDASEELAGGGGGASDLRSAVSSDLSTRLIVAAGGGGGGSGRGGGTGTAGGNAGQAAASVSSRRGGGAAGGASEGGNGGSGNETSWNGKPGTIGEGGDGAGGGGGGGGLYGGGAGGLSFELVPGNPSRIDACGGGGASSGFRPRCEQNLRHDPADRDSLGNRHLYATGPDSGGSPHPKSSRQYRRIWISRDEGRHLATRSPARRGRFGHRSDLLRPVNLEPQALWKTGKKKKPLVVGKLTEGPLKMGLHSFTLKLNAKGLKGLERLGKLKLILSVKVTPPQGAVATASKDVTLKH